MKCPTCPDSVLVMSERQGVEIDYCATCRGVWLDRGELDKIIERAGAELSAVPAVAPVPPPPAPQQQYEPPRREERRPEPRYEERRPEPRYDERRDDRYDQPYPKKKKKKTSFLEDLFEF